MTNQIPLGDSPKALTEDIVKRPKEPYKATFMEWLADGNAEQILKEQALAAATADITIYTVPKNFTLFLFAASLSVSNVSAAANVTNLYLRGANGVSILAVRTIPTSGQGSMTQQFLSPLKVEEGETIYLNKNVASSDVKVTTTFQGFLLPKKISIR